MLQDLHSHTYYSYCGKDSPESVIKNAIDKGLELVGICDHYYGIVLASPGFVYNDDEHRVSMHSKALNRYHEHIRLLAEKYKAYIDVWCGVEITAKNLGYNLLPDGVDVSMFDYCLIENFHLANTAVENIFDFAKRCACKKTGLAHVDLPAYIAAKGLDINEFFKQMSEQDIFWEINVNYDSVHHFREHQYAKDFFEDTKLQDLIRKNNVKLSVGFDGHHLEDYDIERVITANRKIQELSLELIR